MPSVCSQLNLLSRASPSRLVSGEKEVQRMRVCVAKDPSSLRQIARLSQAGARNLPVCLLACLGYIW